MTSKKSSVNPLLYTFKCGFKSSAAAAALGNMGCIGIFTVLMSSLSLFGKSPVYNDEGEVIDVVSNASNYTYLFFSSSDIISVAVLIFSALFSVLTALCLFKFITDKKTVNVFYSLGTTRTTLFLGRYLAGAAMLAAATLLPMLLSLIINLITVGASAKLFSAFFYITLSIIATQLIAFSVTSAVFACVGTSFEAATFTVIVLCFPMIIFFSLQTLMASFLRGSPYGESFTLANGLSGSTDIPTLMNKFGFLNPMLFASDDLALFSALDNTGKYNPEMLIASFTGQMTEVSGAPNFVLTFAYIAAAAAICALGIYLFKKRKAEICGFIGTNKVLNTVGVFAAAFFAFCLTVSAVSSSSAVLRVIAAAAAFCAVYFALEALLLRDTKKLVKGLIKLPVEIAVSVIAVALFAGGLFGFSTRMPALSQIESAAITMNGINDEFGICPSDEWSGSYNIEYSPAGNMVDGFSSEKDLEKIFAIHKNAAKAADDDSGSGRTVRIIYTLKNGKKFYRVFRDVSQETYTSLITLQNSDFLQERLDAIFTGELKSLESDNPAERDLAEFQHTLRTDSAGIRVIAKYLNCEAFLNLSQAEREELAEALYKDIKNRTFEGKYHPAKTPLFYLNFSPCNTSPYEEIEGENPGKITFSETDVTNLYDINAWWKAPQIAVTEDMTNTVEFVKSLGIFEKLTAAPEFTNARIVTLEKANSEFFGYYDERETHSQVFGAKFMNDTPESYYMNDVTATDEAQTVTGKKAVSKLFPCGFTSYLADGDGYVVTFSNEKRENVTLFIPSDKMPMEYRK